MSVESTLNEVVAAARSLVEPGGRRILGITGAPGSGKSTLAEDLALELKGDAALVSLDGFHLADDELHRLGRYDRKGAADTFDAAGYTHMLRRLRDRAERVVYAATFDRALEASFAGSVPLSAEVPLIITEGNYLLVQDDDWGGVSALLDQCWYVDPGEDVRMKRLVARHMRFGRSGGEAHDRSYGPDQRNAELIANTRSRANRIVRVPTRNDLVSA